MKKRSAVVFLPPCRYQEALSYLVYAYQSNAALLMKGPRRGVKESVIALYRRKCLLVCTAYKTLISSPSLAVLFFPTLDKLSKPCLSLPFHVPALKLLAYCPTMYEFVKHRAAFWSAVSSEPQWMHGKNVMFSEVTYQVAVFRTWSPVYRWLQNVRVGLANLVTFPPVHWEAIGKGRCNPVSLPRSVGPASSYWSVKRWLVYRCLYVFISSDVLWVYPPLNILIFW